MELWQLDLVGRFHLKDGTELKCLTGIDDHSRYCVSARLMVRATARPVCAACKLALCTHGLPRQVLTDNGRVFTAGFSKGPGPVLFDTICVDNGIDHLWCKILWCAHHAKRLISAVPSGAKSGDHTQTAIVSGRASPSNLTFRSACHSGGSTFHRPRRIQGS
jgi:hypothetical protein